MEKILSISALFSIFLLVSVTQVHALQDEDVNTSCRDDLVLVYKINAKLFVCTPPDTAKKWVDLGLAEYTNPDDANIVTEIKEVEKEIQYSPPPAGVKNVGVTKDTEVSCREKMVLVFRYNSNNYLCTSEKTAKTWIQQGIAEYVIPESEFEVMEEMMEESIEEAMKDEAMKETMEEMDEIVEEITSPTWKSISGTRVSMQDPGLGHEAHQLAIILPPSQNIYKGILSYSASEPIQLVSLHGPLSEGESSGQPIWTPDGETKFALTFIDPETSMGSWMFSGNAIAVHTMNEEEFTVSYSVGYMELQSEISNTGTIISMQDPGLGHEAHQLAIILPPSESIYSGILTYSASEPIQLVSLHGPLSEGESSGQPIWTPDGETKFALTFIDPETSMGSWMFSGNAIAVHTMNEEEFTVSYSVASMQQQDIESEIMTHEEESETISYEAESEIMEQEELESETITHKEESKTISQEVLEYNPEIDVDDFSTNIDNEFFTLTLGTTLVYEGETEDGLEHIEVKVIDDTKIVMGIETVVVWDRVWLDGDLIEDTLDWYAQDEDDNVWYFGEESFELKDGKIISTEGSWEAGVDGALPGIIMHADPSSIDDPYRQEFFVGEAEDWGQVISVNETVITPYGTFEGCVKTLDWTTLEEDSEEHKYYCSEIGGLVSEMNLATGETIELVDAKIDN